MCALSPVVTRALHRQRVSRTREEPWEGRAPDELQE